MGLFSSLKKLKLKKIVPGKILVNIAKKIGGPIGGIASAAEKIVAGGKQVGINLGASNPESTPLENTEQMANALAAGTQAAVVATSPDVKRAADNTRTMLLIGGGVVLLFLLLRRR